MNNFAKITLLATLALGCAKDKQFPDEPFVELRSYKLVPAGVDSAALNEHLYIKFYFTDGDGNIGLEDNQLNPPHCQTCDHYYNMFVNVYSKRNGVFELTYPYNARIKNLSPAGQNQSLEGYMEYKIDIANRLSDTIMVDFYIEDRDLNKSNLGSTPSLYVKF